MTQSISDHWGTGDVYATVLTAMHAAGIAQETATIADLAPVDHFHARGFQATRELGDDMPIRPGDRLIDIGCGLGGPARYLADRFGCHVEGIDITAPFVDAANRLSALVGIADRVHVREGDGQHLPFAEESFDGAYSQHVLMNVPDRARLFGEAMRVLRPGGFFALTEHGLGPVTPVHYPVPWSDEGGGEYLRTPEQTVDQLAAIGFRQIELVETREKYLQGYRSAIEKAARGELPPFGVHILLGPQAGAKLGNAARNIEEGRTRPVQIICRKPG